VALVLFSLADMMVGAYMFCRRSELGLSAEWRGIGSASAAM
jgi:hypothetical protein